MEVNAKARYIRMSPKKVRLVLAVIREMGVEEAVKQLQFLNKKATEPILKLLNSAIANATNNFNLEKSNLFIKELMANDGPTLKRWRPRAFGRATPIRKRTTHISIILAEKEPSKQIKKNEEKVSAPVSIKDFQKGLESENAEKSSEKTETSKDQKGGKQEIKDKKKDKREQTHVEQLRKNKKKGVLRSIFNRKTG